LMPIWYHVCISIRFRPCFGVRESVRVCVRVCVRVRVRVRVRVLECAIENVCACWRGVDAAARDVTHVHTYTRHTYTQPTTHTTHIHTANDKALLMCTHTHIIEP